MTQYSASIQIDIIINNLTHSLYMLPNLFHLTFSRKMLREDRWQNLIEQFRTENFRLYQLSNQSVFAVSLQAGLSALKTTQCYRQSVDRNNECPVCHAALNKLAATLPFAHCSQSRLICHITGKPLGKTKVSF